MSRPIFESTNHPLRRNRQRIRKIPLKSMISEGFWSEWRASNARLPHPQKSFDFRGCGPRWETRTPGILLPKKSRSLFLLICSGFWCFLICFTYSLTLLSPLFPGVPEPYVVIYVVKNASRPVSGEDSPVPDGKRFSLLLAAL